MGWSNNDCVMANVALTDTVRYRPPFDLNNDRFLSGRYLVLETTKFQLSTMSRGAWHVAVTVPMSYF